jgi:hypothetical protein
MDARTKVVDCSGVRSEQEFWAAYVRDVSPESPDFGRNFHAFRDALWGGPGWPDADELRFIHTSSLAPLHDGQFLDILREMARGIDSVRLVFE